EGHRRTMQASRSFRIGERSCAIHRSCSRTAVDGSNEVGKRVLQGHDWVAAAIDQNIVRRGAPEAAGIVKGVLRAADSYLIAIGRCAAEREVCAGGASKQAGSR